MHTGGYYREGSYEPQLRGVLGQTSVAADGRYRYGSYGDQSYSATTPGTDMEIRVKR